MGQRNKVSIKQLILEHNSFEKKQQKNDLH